MPLPPDSLSPLALAAAAPLAREFFARPAPLVGRDLIGAILVHESAAGLVAARLVEVEAYNGPEDRASHARAGRTVRTAPMFGPPGHAYVFLVYGMYHCLNVVTGAEGEAGAVLLRAAAPLAGTHLMRQRRARPHDSDRRIASGPGRLAAAFGVDGAFNGADLVTGPLRLLRARPQPREIVAGPRVGVAYAGEPWASLPWRFHLRADPAVSR